MNGPGKYDDVCTQARETAQAAGALLLLVDGNRGSGFSVQGPVQLIATLPDLLIEMVGSMRADLESCQRPESGAYALLTIGKAAGMLSRSDIKGYVVDALRSGTLMPHYLVALRDKLDEVLRVAECSETQRAYNAQSGGPQQ